MVILLISPRGAFLIKFLKKIFPLCLPLLKFLLGLSGYLFRFRKVIFMSFLGCSLCLSSSLFFNYRLSRSLNYFVSLDVYFQVVVLCICDSLEVGFVVLVRRLFFLSVSVTLLGCSLFFQSSVCSCRLKYGIFLFYVNSRLNTVCYLPSSVFLLCQFHS